MTLKFGYERRDWDAAKSEIVAILGERVRSGRGPMTYGELASKVKAISLEPHQYAMFAILGEVSDDEDSMGRGMLSAYVVTAETGIPGGGFFELAENLGRRVDDRLAFWVAANRLVSLHGPERRKACTRTATSTKGSPATSGAAPRTGRPAGDRTGAPSAARR